MLELYKGFIENYGVITIEDPYEQDDWDNWKAIVAESGDKCQIVGDDHLVTNPTRIKKGIDQKSSNALLLKVRDRMAGPDAGPVGGNAPRSSHQWHSSSVTMQTTAVRSADTCTVTRNTLLAVRTLQFLCCEVSTGSNWFRDC